MKIVAHRGLRFKGVKDNSIDSINLALANDIKVIELDIQKTRDEIILFHNSTIKGISVKRMKYNPKKFVKLDDALKIIPKNITIIADMKVSGIEKEVMNKLKGRKVIYFSHIKKVLLELKRLDKNVRLGIYYISKANLRSLLRRVRYVKKFFKNAHKYSAEIIAVPGPYITPKFMDRAKKEGFKIYVYYVPKPKYFRRAIKMKVDAIEVDWVKDLELCKKIRRKL